MEQDMDDRIAIEVIGPGCLFYRELCRLVRKVITKRTKLAKGIPIMRIFMPMRRGHADQHKNGKGY